MVSSPEERNALNRQRNEFVAQVEAPTRTAIQFEGGIPQSLALLNGAFVEELTAPATSDLVAAVVDNPFMTDKRRVQTLYLAALTRLPDDEEGSAMAQRWRSTYETPLMYLRLKSQSAYETRGNRGC